MTLPPRLYLCLFFLLGGCAYVPQNQVAPSPLPSLAEGKQKPGVHISVNHYFGSPVTPLGASSLKVANWGTDPQLIQILATLTPLAPPNMQQNTTQIVRQILNETALFEHVAVNGEPAQPGDYQLSLSVYTYWPLDGGDALASMATLLTFGLFPSSRPQEFKLILDLYGPDNRALARVANADAIDQRVGLINLGRLGDTPEKAERDTLKRQVDALLMNAVKHGVIPELVQASTETRG
ncbi:hypothetical protein ACX3YG_14995 [Pseudomonas wadenswilerensis]